MNKCIENSESVLFPVFPVFLLCTLSRILTLLDISESPVQVTATVAPHGQRASGSHNISRSSSGRHSDDHRMVRLCPADLPASKQRTLWDVHPEHVALQPTDKIRSLS